jgi:hypothetical protein
VDIGVVLARQPTDLTAWLADATAFDAAGADALCLDLPADAELDPVALLTALAATTFRADLITIFPIGAPPRTIETIRRLRRGRRVLTGVPEGWVSAPPPGNRAAWQSTLADAASRGVTGLLVPADPRLLDLLRNPGDPGERHDLQLAQG